MMTAYVAEEHLKQGDQECLMQSDLVIVWKKILISACIVGVDLFEAVPFIGVCCCYLFRF